MAEADTYWYLEHKTTGRTIILQAGENTLGRHSSCTFTLSGYEFLSRRHAKLIVRGNSRVIVEQMNALNGVFINNRRLDGNRFPLISEDTIGLGVFITGRQNGVVPEKHAIFVLKQSAPIL
ncbi:hypothetical protein ACLKA7_017622 [Drosophila subpalustris]